MVVDVGARLRHFMRGAGTIVKFVPATMEDEIGGLVDCEAAVVRLDKPYFMRDDFGRRVEMREMTAFPDEVGEFWFAC